MKLTVAGRMGRGFGLVLAAMTAGALIMTFSIGTVKERAMLIRSESLPLADEAARMQFETVNVQQFLTDVSATGEEDGFAEAAKSATIFRQGVARFESLASQDGNTVQMDELKALAADFEAMYEQGSRMAKTYIKEGRAAGNVLMTDFDARTEALAKRIDPLKDKHFKAADQRMTEVVADLTSDLRLQYILLALSLIIGIGTALTLSRNILNQLGAEPETVAALAREVADGRFDKARALCAKGRAIGGVMSAMAAMAAKLEASFGEIAANGPRPKPRPRGRPQPPGGRTGHGQGRARPPGMNGRGRRPAGGPCDNVPGRQCPDRRVGQAANGTTVSPNPHQRNATARRK
jgi:methyl-accepting chemotaxis protein